MTSRRGFFVASTAAISWMLVGGKKLLASTFVSKDDPTAKALGYVEKASNADAKKFPTYKEGNHCANCNLYIPIDAEKGACTIFQNKWVPQNAWCASWIEKEE